MLTKDGIIKLKGMVEATTAEWGAGKGHRDCLIIAYDSHLECSAENEKLRKEVERLKGKFCNCGLQITDKTLTICEGCKKPILADGKKEE